MPWVLMQKNCTHINPHYLLLREELERRRRTFGMSGCPSSYARPRGHLQAFNFSITGLIIGWLLTRGCWGVKLPISAYQYPLE
ncbi:hypothetical protein CDAR_211511 [Caerostris darwini]|uniref:Uncharacterized protein n=1 Tax=Caerostris darwini TaxID=1538125 RepID=A0AAV4P1X6_9ARAC|nr:hypothetical protein CDAR_211511 [Caerostris darwini]